MVDLSLVDDACADAFGEDVGITPKHRTRFDVVAIVRRGTRTDLLGPGAGNFASPAWVVEVRKSVWPQAEKEAAVELVDGCFEVDSFDQDDAGVCWRLDLKKV